MTEKIVKTKTNTVMEYITKEEVEEYMDLHSNSYNRLEMLMEMCCCDTFIKDVEDFAELLGYYYSSCDNLYYYRGVVRKAFTYASLRKERLMTTEELEFLKNLPDKVTIYRGMTVEESTKEHQGVSWTLDKKVAEFFAYQYIRNQSTAKKPKTVVEKVIDKSEIIAVFLGREEQEIIYIGTNPDGKDSDEDWELEEDAEAMFYREDWELL